MVYDEETKHIDIESDLNESDWHRLRDLEVESVSIGSQVTDISFLSLIQEVKDFSACFAKFDSTHLQLLSNLRRMYLLNIQCNEIEFAGFKLLERLECDYGRATSKIAEAASLNTLIIRKMPTSQLDKLAYLTRLENLSLFGSDAENLDVLSKNANLRSFRLVRLRKLRNNEFLSNLLNLERILIQDSSGFSSFEPYASLTQLENLCIEGAGEVESLEPLKESLKLEVLALQSAKGDYVRDDNPNYVLDLPNSKILFCKRNKWNYYRSGDKWENLI